MHLEPRNDGTFLVPPASYESAAEFAMFWINVPISDEVLSNIAAGYAALMRKQRDLVQIRWLAAAKKELKLAKFGFDVAGVGTLDEHIAAWQETYPERIKADEVRAIARAGQLYYYSSVVGYEACVGDLTLMIGGEEMSVKDIAERYQLGELRLCFEQA